VVDTLRAKKEERQKVAAAWTRAAAGVYAVPTLRRRIGARRWLDWLAVGVEDRVGGDAPLVQEGQRFGDGIAEVPLAALTGNQLGADLDGRLDE